MCAGGANSVRLELTPGTAECLVASADQCKIPMHDFTRLDYDFAIDGCDGVWAAPLWMSPDTWQWGAGSGEIDSLELCGRDAAHLNFAGGGHQTIVAPSQLALSRANGHLTVRKDGAGIVTIVACSASEARAQAAALGSAQCVAPVYTGCADCMNASNTYGCWCNDATSPKHIYGSGGCQNGADCMWTLVSDIWNGVSGDQGFASCMTAVPSVNLSARVPNLQSHCAISVENIVVRGGGVNGSLQWGAGSPTACAALTTSVTARLRHVQKVV